MRLFIASILLCSFSCTPIATYPPIENRTAKKFTEKVSEPVPTILATTIKYAFDKFGGMETIVFNLPEGLDEKIYSRVIKRLNNATAITDDKQAAYHIVQLRVRGLKAEADVLFPALGWDEGGWLSADHTSEYRMATIHLEGSLVDEWKVTRDRVWRVPVTEIPSPNKPSVATAE
tara:strand:+ start:230 stop:754 length:525 start_codon:yes stop_codon:yes gene_type:complete